MKKRLWLVCASTCCAMLIASGLVRAEEKSLPRVAVFPLGGDASSEFRDKAAFSLRAKLDRTGAFEVVDGYAMADLVEGSPVDAKTSSEQVQKLAPEAAILIWGDFDQQDTGRVLQLHILDKRGDAGATPRDFNELVKTSPDLRFAVEHVLATIKDVKPFEHMTEDAVVDDAAARRMWDDPNNPNLVVNADFSSPPGKPATLPTTGTAKTLLDARGAYDPEHSSSAWHWVLGPKTNPVRYFDALPDTDQVVIYRASARGGAAANPYLIMNLSKNTAENNGLVARSALMPIKPKTRYRLSFTYRSDGPTQRVFVKGFTVVPDITGNDREREIYRRQVPPSGNTDGQWKNVVVDLNPQQPTFPVQLLRVDLYAYLTPGQIAFDDIVLKEVGAQTRVAKDEALDSPVKK